MYMYICMCLYLVLIPCNSKCVYYIGTYNCNWFCLCICICSCIYTCICVCICIRLLLLYDSYHDIQKHYRSHHHNYCIYHVARSNPTQQLS